jgi:hypothetical protein
METKPIMVIYQSARSQDQPHRAPRSSPRHASRGSSFLSGCMKKCADSSWDTDEDSNLVTIIRVFSIFFLATLQYFIDIKITTYSTLQLFCSIFTY